MFENARLAEQKSKNAQEKEEGILGDYENKIGQYVDGSRETVTIDKEEYEKLVNTVNELKTMQPTEIKSDVYIRNTYSNLETYSDKTTMNAFTRTTDDENKISEYLSYSQESGYTVLKSGWYFVKLSLSMSSNATVASSANLDMYINGISMMHVTVSSGKEGSGNDNNYASIYLKQGDVIYFKSKGTNTASSRNLAIACYPMFKKIKNYYI